MNRLTLPAKHRVFLVDDHPIVRAGLTSLINRESDLIVCGEAEDAPGAIQLIPSSIPDILIVDLSLKGPDGIDLIKDLHLRCPSLPVLVLSMHDESVYAERALRAGARGYIMKQQATENVLVALRRILEGEIYVSDNVAKIMLQRYVGATGATPSTSVEGLTDRELEVFRLIGEGHSTRAIAEALHISLKTVESYKAHIKEKLSLGNASELIRRAVEWTISKKTA